MSRVEAREVEPADLPALRRQFQAWRAHKGSGEAIPPKLWQGAAALARRHGAGRIALALGLDSHKLKQVSLGRWPVRGSKRARARRGVQGKPRVAAVAADARFIELKAPVGSGGPLDGEAVVEFLGADAGRITHGDISRLPQHTASASDASRTLAGRTLRVIPMGRKNWNFCWTELGAKQVGIVQSLITTCRLHEIDVYAYLVDVLQRVGQHPASRVAELTPRLWKQHFAANPLRSALHTLAA